MKHNFRIIIGMLLLAIPLCLNAQVKPVKKDNPNVPKTEISEKKESKGGLEMPKISGYVQGLYQANLGMVGDSADRHLELSDNTFRMRRVRLSVEGTLFKGLTYKIQGDFSRSPMLVDAFLKYKVCNEFAIQLGQFKTPFTLESPINPVNLEIFDYGESVKYLGGYDDVCGVGGLGRDIGLMASGSLFPVQGEEGVLYNIVDYAVGVFNGNGPVSTDNKGKDDNNRKDLVGRLNVHLGMKALTLSGSYYYGQYSNGYSQGARNRWAGGVQYDDGNIIIRSEYIGGATSWQDYNANHQSGIEEIYEIYKYNDGFYAVAGYNFRLGKDKSQVLMPVLRYENFITKTDEEQSESEATNWYTIGVNYWPLKSVNFKLDYSLIQQDISTSHRVVGILSYKF